MTVFGDFTIHNTRNLPDYGKKEVIRQTYQATIATITTLSNENVEVSEIKMTTRS